MRFLCLLGLLLISGCVYTFSNSLPNHLKSVHIPVFTNETLEVGLAEELTTAVTDRFAQNNKLQVVTRDADAVLTGDIVGYEERVLGFSSDQRAEEYLVVVSVDMTLQDRVKNREVWSEEGIRGRASYFPDATTQGTAATVEEAITLAVEQIVDVAISRTFEGW
ncbi:MAG: LptE family protein [Candidatus Eisenbacteria bacterium]|uniref:LptE family protein n=1 Tax=Eiseniibacteriota bacterium TaxID=2212470 RepID=A0A7Y2H3L6_UNCEI|nr:LptE family protein [Candidatus Eisenbacteria bacterium]